MELISKHPCPLCKRRPVIHDPRYVGCTNESCLIHDAPMLKEIWDGQKTAVDKKHDGHPWKTNIE